MASPSRRLYSHGGLGLSGAAAAMLLVTFAQTCQLSVERGERIRAERFGPVVPTAQATPAKAAVLLVAAAQRGTFDGLAPTP